MVDKNPNHATRNYLETAYGQVWDTSELQKDFAVIRFMAPYVEVTRKSDGKSGTLLFDHMPRFYYSFSAY